MAIENTHNSAGVALIISAPSGAGKSTIIQRVLDGGAKLHFSVSCTTRKPRPGEVDGKDYYFMEEAEFEEKQAAGAFLESACVHGNYYGTLRSEVESYIKAGEDVILEIDVQGAAQLRDGRLEGLLKKAAVFIFISPPSLDELEKRLRSRGTETEDVIQKRLKNARDEMAQKDHFDHVIVNDDLDAAVKAFKDILDAARDYRA